MPCVLSTHVKFIRHQASGRVFSGLTGVPEVQSIAKQRVNPATILFTMQLRKSNVIAIGDGVNKIAFVSYVHNTDQSIDPKTAGIG